MERTREWHRTEEIRIKELERKAAGYDAMIAAESRVVVTVAGGLVSSVFCDQQNLEVVIVDLDNVNSATDAQGRAAFAWKQPLQLASMSPEVANPVKALDGDEIECEQCGNTYRNEDGYDAWHCSSTCHNRHWRM